MNRINSYNNTSLDINGLILMFEIDGKVVGSCLLLGSSCPMYVIRHPLLHPALTQDQLLDLFSHFLCVVFEFSFPLWQQPAVLLHCAAFDITGHCPLDGFWASSFSH